VQETIAAHHTHTSFSLTYSPTHPARNPTTTTTHTHTHTVAAAECLYVGDSAFRTVYETLAETAAQESGDVHADGLTSSMWHFALSKDGSAMALSKTQLDQSHAHLSAGYCHLEISWGLGVSALPCLRWQRT